MSDPELAPYPGWRTMWRDYFQGSSVQQRVYDPIWSELSMAVGFVVVSTQVMDLNGNHINVHKSRIGTMGPNGHHCEVLAVILESVPETK